MGMARGHSEGLRLFVESLPHERGPILAFVERVAAGTRAGADVLDVGAGDAPYRELFSHASYRTLDWDGSPHEQAGASDIVARGEAIPLPDASCDVVVLTQVLEHVPEPHALLTEVHRILRPGGRIAVTAPLAWPLHELPDDYYRYTSAGLEHRLRAAGFDAIEVRTRNDCFTTLAELMRETGVAMGRAPDGLDSQREEAAALLATLAEQVAALAPLDAARIFPLGYEALAVRPPDRR